MKSFDLSDQAINRLKRLTASKGRIFKFIERRALRLVSLYGEVGSALASAVASEMVGLSIKLREFNLQCIFSVDEKKLFFKFLPRQTQGFEVEMVKAVEETKAMKSENPVTACVCTIAAGDEV